MPSARSRSIDRCTRAVVRARCCSICARPWCTLTAIDAGRGREPRDAVVDERDVVDRAQRLGAQPRAAARAGSLRRPPGRRLPHCQPCAVQPVDEPVAAPDPADRDVPALHRRGLRRSSGCADRSASSAWCSWSAPRCAGLGIANEYKWGWKLGRGRVGARPGPAGAHPGRRPVGDLRHQPADLRRSSRWRSSRCWSTRRAASTRRSGSTDATCIDLRHDDDHRRHRRAEGQGRGAPRVLRLRRDHPGAGEPLRRRHRRPPVDPRRPRAGEEGEPVRRPDRPRLPHAVARADARAADHAGRRRHDGA